MKYVRHLVGHAHQHDDVELGTQARRHNGEYQAVHRLRGRERPRRRPRRGVERRLGRRLDSEPQRVLLHESLSRLRSRRARPLRTREGREADRAQRDVRRNRELRAADGQRLRALRVARPRRHQVGVRDRHDHGRALALEPAHGTALPPRDREGGAVPHHARRARADSRHGRAPHLSQHDEPRGSAGAGIQRLGRRGRQSSEHETILFFTRLLDGPMDFTPGIFDILRTHTGPARTNEDARVRTTLASSSRSTS